MKLCTTCGISKPLESFATNNTKKDGKHDKCRECKKIYNREYYQKTKHIHNPARYERRKVMVQTTRTFILEYLKEHPCVDCGITNPVVLQFDHRNDVEKLYNVADLIRKAGSIKVLIDEIEKCDVRCANCHAIRTAKQQGWYKNVSIL